MSDKRLKLEILLAAIDKVTGPARAVDRALESTSRALAENGKRLQALKAQQKDVAGLKRQEQALVENQIALTSARDKVRQLQSAWTAAEKPSAKLTREYTRARDAVMKLEKAQDSYRVGLRETETRLTAAGVDVRRLATEENRLEREFEGTNRAINEQSDQLKRLQDRQRQFATARQRYDRTQQFAGTAAGAGASALGAGMAAAAPLIAAGGAAVNFQDVMLDVRKVVDFETPQQFAAMSSDILDLSTRLPIAAEGVAQIVAAAGQAKIPRQELLGFAEDAAKMGVAFDTTAEDAGQKMATWRTAFAMTQPQVRGLADQINYLGDNGNATALQISDVVTRIGPLGQIAGLASGQIAALGSTIVGMGVAEEIAATGIKNTMLALTKGEAATSKQKAAYAALGLEASDVARRMQVDAGGTIMDTLERISRLDPSRQAAILTQLFGSESVAAIAPMLTNLDVLRGNLEAVGDASKYAGSMDREFQNRMSGAKAGMDMAKNSVKALAIEVGSAFLPQIKAGAAVVAKMAQGVRDFAKAHPGLIRVIGGLLAVVAVALTVFGGLALAVAAVLGPFALMQFAVAGAAPLFAGLGPVLGVVAKGLGVLRIGIMGVGRALLMNPIGLIITAIAVAAFLIIRYWGPISGFFKGLWNGVKSVTAAAFNGIKGAITRFNPMGAMRSAWAGAKPFFSNLWSGVSSLARSGAGALKTAFFSFSPMGLLISNWGPISAFLGRVLGRAREAVANGLAAVRNAFAGFNPLTALQSAFAASISWLSNLPGRFLKLGADAVGGLVRGIRGQKGAAQAAAAEAGGAAEEGYRARTQTRSPSRLFARLGRYSMDGLSLGIRQGGAPAAASMRRAAAAVAAAGAVSVAGPAFAEGTAIDEGPRIGPASAGGAGRGQGGGGTMTVTINVYGAPGQDVSQLAEQVAARLKGLGSDNGAFADDGWEDA